MLDLMKVRKLQHVVKIADLVHDFISTYVFSPEDLNLRRSRNKIAHEILDYLNQYLPFDLIKH